MKKRISVLLSMLLALTMLVSLAAPAMAETAMSVPLVSGDGAFSQKFSPFFSDSVYDSNVNSFLHVGALALDRKGNTVYNGGDGETIAYEGKDYTYYSAGNIKEEYDAATDIATYTTSLRKDIVFSDGEPLTADDLIFTYYVFLDPSYAGSTTLNAFDILGYQEYKYQMPVEAVALYADQADAIIEAGADHVWAEGDKFTKEQQDWYWAKIKEVWKEDVQALTDYIVATYGAAYAQAILQVTPEEITAEPGLQVAFAMGTWGFGDLEEVAPPAEEGAAEEATEEVAEEEATEEAAEEVAEEATEEAAAEEAPKEFIFKSGVLGKTWTLKDGDFPTVDDFFEETYAAYAGDAGKYWTTENNGDADVSDVVGTVHDAYIANFNDGSVEAPEGGYPNISGIKKLDEYTVEVKLKGYSAPAIYSVLGLSIAPMHFYGDKAQYDYENNNFGFPRGDLSMIEAKTATPMVGAGPYKFVKYENKVVYLEANEKYFLGEPKTKYIQMKETQNTEMIPGVQTGTIDVAAINGSNKDFDQIKSINSNAELVGDVIATSLVDNRGYGYIAIQADAVRVGDESFSDASKNLRKGFATVLAVYRDVAYDSYYGDVADVINYPISNISWAAPIPTDEGYKVAFSVDVEGKDIYTDAMAQEDKYTAALEAAKGFFIAAGYTFDEASGVFTAAPEGAKMTYTVTIPADGTGEHPSFSVLTDASNALATLGIELKINDLSDSSILWKMIDAGTADLWCAAWQNNNPDPDMYQTYHSSNIFGLGGSDSNHYHVAIAELDKLLIEGRTTADQETRRAIYKEILEIIVDAAVEVPAYQRKNAVIYSTERIADGTMTPDITTWWDWFGDVDGIVMNAAK